MHAISVLTMPLLLTDISSEAGPVLAMISVQGTAAAARLLQGAIRTAPIRGERQRSLDLGALQPRWGHQSEDRGGKDSLIEATLAFWAAGSFERLQGHPLTPALPALWAYCHCQHHYRPQVIVLKG